ncbi:PH domain-containing protein [Ruania halotolerans]|uniref:PH domain-containing protein n=1 Tax=Ruania halotolerans TaxID=2897773 RepID=UPI001E299C1E|nr:PH domain-containing protein [Ruania halotolerans]UFU07175.1 PH domain-containing protein [Ruania halotolerans]
MTSNDQQQVQWHRLHKITPLLNAWKVAAGLFAVFVWQSYENIRDIDLPVATLLLILAGVIVLGALLGLGFSALAWSRTKYGISDESVFLHSGVIFRQQRHVRLDRLQTVDVTQPLLARLAGFAALKIESAGGAGSNLTLAYLKEDDAQRLRNALLARAAGVHVGSAPAAAGAGAAEVAGGPEPAAIPEAPERHVATLTAGRLIGSLALSGGLVGILVAMVALVVVTIRTGNVGTIFAMGAPLLGGATYFWGRFAGEFNFRVATSPDGIRVRQGLLETKARTVPPGRVQAVHLAQSPLWRFKGWWRITVNIAGYGQEETTGSVLYPVATESEAAYLLSLVHRDFGDPRPLEVLHAGLVGTESDEGFGHTPRRARWLDPLTWRRTGVRLTETATLLRTGRYWRTLTLVPHERVQSLGLEQGPIERRLDLVTVAVHSTPGQIVPRAHHQDAEAMRTLLAELAERARHARHNAGPERWMSTRAPRAASESDPRSAFAGVLPASPRVDTPAQR